MDIIIFMIMRICISADLVETPLLATSVIINFMLGHLVMWANIMS